MSVICLKKDLTYRKNGYDEGSGEDRNETKTRRIDDGEQGSIIY